MKNEEKCLKRFLKRKLSFSLENLVKFLITGTLAFTVTACGGGGGGGDTSQVIKPTGTVSIGNSNPVVSTGEIDDVMNNIDKINTDDDENFNDILDSLNKAEKELSKLKVEDIKTEEDFKKLDSLIKEVNDGKKELETEINNADALVVSQNKTEIDKIKNKISSMEEYLQNLREIAESNKEEIERNTVKSSYKVTEKDKNKILEGKIVGGDEYDVIDIETGLVKSKVVGLFGNGYNNDTNIASNLDIKIENRDDAIGILTNNASVENRGNIKMTGNNIHGINGVKTENKIYFIENKGNIDLNGFNAVGITGLNYKIKNTGTIKVNGSGLVMGINDIKNSFNNPTLMENNGTIQITSSDGEAQGMISNKDKIINNGTLSINGAKDNSFGIYVEGEGTKGVNKKLINVNGKGIGMYAKGLDVADGFLADHTSNVAEIINEKDGVIIASKDSRGLMGGSDGSTVINKGILYTESNKENNIGIFVDGDRSKGINEGTINIAGKGWGMYAQNGATIINEEDGVINISYEAKGAMGRDNSKSHIVNKGTINIEGPNPKFTKTGRAFDENYFTTDIINKGTINIDDDLVIKKPITINTLSNGSYGKLTAGAVQLSSYANVSSEITKKDYKNKYVLKDVVKADELKVDKDFEVKTDSILYSAESTIDNNTLNINLYKIKGLDDVVSPYLKETAKVWDGLLGNEKFEKITDKFDMTNEKSVEKDMKDLYPSMYSNLAREISSKNKFFNSKDKEAINNLNGNQFGFILLNEYKDIKNHNHITGYKTRQNGFVGTVDLGNNLYGNIGYAYDNIKYKENGKSTIQTIHLGLNKTKKLENYEDVNLEFNLSGDYNFHKNTREMKYFDKTAEAKFNSYSIGTSAKISKKFGDELYIKPFSKIELAYMKHKGFTEKNAGLINTRIKEQSYTSFLPQVGFELGKSFNNLNLFANLTYGYELGNLNKAEEFSYEFEKDASRKLVKDDLEKSRVSAQVGVNYKTDSFYVGANIGQDFDKRSNKFMSFTLGYKF